MWEPAQFLVGFERRELARVRLLNSACSSMRRLGGIIRMRGRRTRAVGRAFGSWTIGIVARSAER